MARSEAVDLGDYSAALVSYEMEFQQSKGPAHQAVLQEIVKQIVAESEGSLTGGAIKGLDRRIN